MNDPLGVYALHVRGFQGHTGFQFRGTKKQVVLSFCSWSLGLILGNGPSGLTALDFPDQALV